MAGLLSRSGPWPLSSGSSDIIINHLERQRSQSSPPIIHTPITPTPPMYTNRTLVQVAAASSDEYHSPTLPRESRVAPATATDARADDVVAYCSKRRTASGKEAYSPSD